MEMNLQNMGPLSLFENIAGQLNQNQISLGQMNLGQTGPDSAFYKLFDAMGLGSDMAQSNMALNDPKALSALYEQAGKIHLGQDDARSIIKAFLNRYGKGEEEGSNKEASVSVDINQNSALNSFLKSEETQKAADDETENVGMKTVSDADQPDKTDTDEMLAAVAMTVDGENNNNTEALEELSQWLKNLENDGSHAISDQDLEKALAFFARYFQYHDNSAENSNGQSNPASANHAPDMEIFDSELIKIISSASDATRLEKVKEWLAENSNVDARNYGQVISALVKEAHAVAAGNENGPKPGQADGTDSIQENADGNSLLSKGKENVTGTDKLQSGEVQTDADKKETASNTEKSEGSALNGRPAEMSGSADGETTGNSSVNESGSNSRPVQENSLSDGSNAIDTPKVSSASENEESNGHASSQEAGLQKEHAQVMNGPENINPGQAADNNALVNEPPAAKRETVAQKAAANEYTAGQETIAESEGIKDIKTTQATAGEMTTKKAVIDDKSGVASSMAVENTKLNENKGVGTVAGDNTAMPDETDEMVRTASGPEGRQDTPGQQGKKEPSTGKPGQADTVTLNAARNSEKTAQKSDFLNSTGIKQDSEMKAADNSVDAMKDVSEKLEHMNVSNISYKGENLNTETNQNLSDTVNNDLLKSDAINDAGPKTEMNSANSKTAKISQNMMQGAQAEKQVSEKAVLDQLVNRAVLEMGKNKTELKIDIKPDHLGSIKIQVVSESHQMVAKISAEHIHVKEAIEHNLDQLKADLSKGGIQIDSVDVSVDQEQNSGRSGTKDELAKHARNMAQFRRNNLNGEKQQDTRDNRPYQRQESAIDYYA